MWKLWMCVFAVTGACALATAGVAAAASGGGATGLIPAPAGRTGVPLAVVKTSITAIHITRYKHRRHRLRAPACRRRPHGHGGRGS